MNIRLRNVRRFQEGGPMGGPGAGAPLGGDPVQELAALAQLALQSQDCQAAMQVCDGLLQLLGAGQGAPAGQEAGPEAGAPAPEQAPAGPEGGEPVYRMGGRLLRRGY